MTLIIGKNIGNSIRVDSDSKITNPKIASNKNSVFSGLLKSIILNPYISVSYAGGVETAQSAIEKLYKLPNFNINTVKTELLGIHKETDFETDFLIASIENQGLLYKISEGKIDVSNQSQWIGDSSGFNMYQREFIPNLKGIEPKQIVKAHEDAFEEVVKSGKIESIGGFHITVHTTKKGLEYLMKMSITMGQPTSMVVQANQAVPIPFGDAKTGAYSYSYLISSNPFHPAIGIYFPMGNFGTLYYPRLTREILMLKDVDVFKFAQRVKEDFKIDLTGMVKDGDFMRMI